MSELHPEPRWLTLVNPFPSAVDTIDVITGHVSARRADITEIITGGQSAIILTGAPSIGKSTLIRYLQRTPKAEWSWRDELQDFREQLHLNDIHFIQINLTPLEGIEQKEKLFSTFLEQCALALHHTSPENIPQQPSSIDLIELRELLRSIGRENPNTRIFVMLDSIERLGLPGMRSFPLDTKAQTAQERGIALLDHCNAIRTLVDLVDEFTFFGVILSIKSLPRPKIDDQFTHVSADLARFTTMTLQVFKETDATGLLSQEPEDFGITWANKFKSLGGNSIFSRPEQDWLIDQAGTHPYILQQFCFHTFRHKQEYASRHGIWMALQESDKAQLIELIQVRLSTFLAHLWQRLQSAIDKSSVETKSKFLEFIDSLAQDQDADKEIDFARWRLFGPELRYILYSEGIIRYEPLQPIYSPGFTLINYLSQKAKENHEWFHIHPVPPANSRELHIICPETEEEIILLSELEYRLLKTLLQNPRHSTEEELMKGTWGRTTDRPVFTQRMYQLRKKLKEACEGQEIIENRYGGIYSLNHPEWFYLE